MQFKISIRNSSLAIPMALVMMNAWGLSPTELSQLHSVTQENITYATGATLLDPALKAYFQLDPSYPDPRIAAIAPCVAGTLDIYSANTGAGFALTCKAGPVFGPLVAGKNIIVMKEANSGTALGMWYTVKNLPGSGYPAMIRTAVLEPDPTYLNSCAPPVAIPAQPPFMAYNTYSCSLQDHTAFPNVSFSEQDPSVWAGINPITRYHANAFRSYGRVASVLQVPLGIIVNIPLRNRLQLLQGKIAGSELLDDVPSLTFTQIAAILSGQMLDWGDVWVTDASGNTMAQVGNGTTSGMHICRYGDANGIELAAETYFFGNHCSKGNGVGSVAWWNGGSLQGKGGTWTGDVNAFTFGGATPLDVKQCVATTTIASNDTVAYRIGFVTGDANPASNPPLGFRYIAIDGQLPTIWSVQQHRYDWLIEPTIQYTTASAPGPGGVGTASLSKFFALNDPGNRKIIWDTIIGHMGNAVSLTALNRRSQNTVGVVDSQFTGAADSGFLTLGLNWFDAWRLDTPPILYSTPPYDGPSTPIWPSVIRNWLPLSIPIYPFTAGDGATSTVSKTYPGQPVNGCNPPYQKDPAG